jgi:hypothetical protein
MRSESSHEMLLGKCFAAFERNGIFFIRPSVLTLLLALEVTAFGRHDYGEIVQGWAGGCGLGLLLFCLTGLLIMEAIKKCV